MTILGERCVLSRPVRGTGERFPQGGPLGESPLPRRETDEVRELELEVCEYGEDSLKMGLW